MIWQATRQLKTGDGRAFEVSLGTPEAAPDGRSWRCALRYVVDGTAEVQHAEGIDAFQALQMALATIHRDVTAQNCAAEGFPPGDHQFYRLVAIDPLMHDVAKFNAAIDRELEDIKPAPLRRAVADELKAAAVDLAAKAAGTSRDGED